MRKICLSLIAAVLMLSCGDQPGNNTDSQDSTSTDPITNPSYNPKAEADSAAKHMNLDSTSDTKGR